MYLFPGGKTIILTIGFLIKKSCVVPEMLPVKNC